MRSIDADAIYDTLSDIFIEHLATSSNTDTRNAFDSLYHTVLSAVETAPTIYPDEVRGVVHCGECKWCHAGYCEKYDDLIPWGCANKPWEDWFCADGAKMEVSEDA